MKKVLGLIFVLILCLRIHSFAIEIDGLNITVFGNIFLQGGQHNSEVSYMELEDQQVLLLNDDGTPALDWEGNQQYTTEQVEVKKTRTESNMVNDGFFTGGLLINKEFDYGAQAGLTIITGSGNSRMGVNNAAFDNNSNVIISHLYYLHPLIEDKLSVKIGRIGSAGGDNIVLGSYGGRYSGFVHPLFTEERSNWGAFEGDEADAWGIIFKASPSELIEITYGYAGPNGKSADTTEITYKDVRVLDDAGNEVGYHVMVPIKNTVPGKTYHIDADGYNALEINFKFIEKANYRFKYWKLNEAKVKDEIGPSGFSISLDQEIKDYLKVGLRYGSVSDSKTLPYTSYSSLSVKESFAIGAEFNGFIWERDADTAGIAVGRETYNNLTESPNALLGEIYYKYTLRDYISIVPSFQYRKLNSDIDDIVTETHIVYGLRTHISF